MARIAVEFVPDSGDGELLMDEYVEPVQHYDKVVAPHRRSGPDITASIVSLFGGQTRVAQLSRQKLKDELVSGAPDLEQFRQTSIFLAPRPSRPLIFDKESTSRMVSITSKFAPFSASYLGPLNGLPNSLVASNGSRVTAFDAVSILNGLGDDKDQFLNPYITSYYRVVPFFRMLNNHFRLVGFQDNEVDVMEVGCGTDFSTCFRRLQLALSHAPELRLRSFSVIDPEPFGWTESIHLFMSMFGRAIKPPKLHIYARPFEDFVPFADAPDTFDVIYGDMCAHHAVGTKMFAHTLSSLLRPRGSAIFSVPNPDIYLNPAKAVRCSFKPQGAYYDALGMRCRMFDACSGKTFDDPFVQWDNEFVDAYNHGLIVQCHHGPGVPGQYAPSDMWKGCLPDGPVMVLVYRKNFAANLPFLRANLTLGPKIGYDPKHVPAPNSGRYCCYEDLVHLLKRGNVFYYSYKLDGELAYLLVQPGPGGRGEGGVSLIVGNDVYAVDVGVPINYNGNATYVYQCELIKDRIVVVDLLMCRDPVVNQDASSMPFVVRNEIISHSFSEGYRQHYHRVADVSDVVKLQVPSGCDGIILLNGLSPPVLCHVHGSYPGTAIRLKPFIDATLPDPVSGVMVDVKLVDENSIVTFEYIRDRPDKFKPSIPSPTSFTLSDLRDLFKGARADPELVQYWFVPAYPSMDKGSQQRYDLYRMHQAAGYLRGDVAHHISYNPLLFPYARSNCDNCACGKFCECQVCAASRGSVNDFITYMLTKGVRCDEWVLQMRSFRMISGDTFRAYKARYGEYVPRVHVAKFDNSRVPYLKAAAGVEGTKKYAPKVDKFGDADVVASYTKAVYASMDE